MFPSDDRASFVDRAFAPPLETILRLPPPPSVNDTRRVNWAFKKQYDRWINACHGEIMAAGGMRNFQRMPGQYEVTIILDENLNNIDLDNGTKNLIDYCRRVGLVVDDNKKYMRQVLQKWGHAPRGCNLILRSVAP